VVANSDRDIGAQFYPKFWTLIALIIAWLPWPIYKKLNF
jgi:hypothetical protein